MSASPDKDDIKRSQEIPATYANAIMVGTNNFGMRIAFGEEHPKTDQIYHVAVFLPYPVVDQLIKIINENMSKINELRNATEQSREATKQ